MKVTISDIQKATSAFAGERQKLTTMIQQLNDEIERLKKSKLAEIRKAVNATAEKKSVLTGLIEAAKDLFTKPRTLIFHGVKVGFQKGKGSLEWEDDEQVVKLIKKVCPEQVDVLVKTTEKPVKATLLELDTATLKKLGITVEETGDQVVIRPTDSQVDKIVTALLKEAEDQ